MTAADRDDNAWFREYKAKKDAEAAAALAAAKAEAHAAGKEPFDFDRFEELFDTSSATGHLASREARLRTWEDRYYLVHRDVKTLEAFAKLMEELEGWR